MSESVNTQELFELINRQNSLILNLTKQLNEQDKLLNSMKTQMNNFIFDQ